MRIIALLSAVLTGISLFLFLKSLSRPLEPETREVLVAAEDIQPNQLISTEMLAVKNLPVEAVHPMALQKVGQAVGLVSESKITAGEQILSSELLEVGAADSSSLAYSISPGMRAITLEVDQFSGLAYLIEPGNRVDLIAELPGPEEASEEDGAGTNKTVIYSRLLVEDSLVVAVDSVLSGKGATSKKDKAADYTALTIQVTPEQAMEISLAKAAGSLNVVLRCPLDDEITGLPNCTVETVLSR